jgi:hypothetical protein
MQITFSIFPKFYRHLDPRGLAALVHEVGLDTTNAVIRDGYWVTPGGMAKELPAFVKAMEEEGLEVRFATAGFSADSLIADSNPLAILADSGVVEFRMDYFRVKDGDPRRSMAEAREALERLVPNLERHGVRAVYQLHHGTLIPSPSAAWQLVKGLPARWIGVELDPGNQAYEGFECWDRAAKLLGEYAVALGVKDVAFVRSPEHAEDPDKGWRRIWAPLDEGITNWHEVVSALDAIDFKGTFVFMPFYDENDPEAMTQKLKREVAYLRGVVAQVAESG